MNLTQDKASQDGKKSQSRVEMKIGQHTVRLLPEKLIVMRNTVHFQRPQGTRADKQIPAKRGKVDGLSPNAARRCKRAFLNTKELNEGIPDWVGLTYPEEWPRDGQVVKRHMDTFGKWAIRQGWCFGWALEYQSRGAPHFHLVLQRGNTNPDSKSPEYKAFREKLAKKWFKVVGSGDPKHLQAGISASPINSPGGATKYLAGYITKNTAPRGGGPVCAKSPRKKAAMTRRPSLPKYTTAAACGAL